ncbi:YrhC family protein [Salibacterium halotolerans]|uniref:YrhC-like protein n=1 Tax=Salibacterium halotolerans TaxID=1884432 RepID=A0A1I5N5F9_9BACI|nr:YrhC family protein [Salibacterium halotolerans]SFP17028.1 YrhC-like protein [Salibacterium halotolerans]
MTQSKTVQAGRAEDFHVFSRVLFTAACFLFFGMLLPESVPAAKQPEMLIIIVIFTAASVLFHQVGKKARQRSEETG